MGYGIIKLIKKFDLVLFFLFLFVTGASFFSLKNRHSEESHLIVTSSGKEFIYPLNKDRDLEIEGIIGKSTIVIKDGRAFFKSSPCKNKTCVHMGAVSKENDWAACLPNDIFIRVE